MTPPQNGELSMVAMAVLHQAIPLEHEISYNMT